MALKVLEDFSAATDRFRPSASIGEVRFDIRSDQITQKSFQRPIIQGADARPPHLKKLHANELLRLYAGFLPELAKGG